MPARYKIIQHENMQDLQDEVEKFLENGYTLAGGVSTTLNTAGTHLVYSQAMAKGHCHLVKVVPVGAKPA